MKFRLERGDVIQTVDGKIMKVLHASEHYIYGQNITDNSYFMYGREKLDNRIKEVYYV